MPFSENRGVQSTAGEVMPRSLRRSRFRRLITAYCRTRRASPGSITLAEQVSSPIAAPSQTVPASLAFALARAGIAGGGEADVGGEVLSNARGQAFGALGGDQRGIGGEAEEVFPDVGPVGEEAAAEDVRGAGDRGEAAAGEA